MNKQIECFITRNYYQLLSISKKITKNHQLSNDLLHEVLLQLYDKENIVLRSYDDNSIKYYITAIMRINFYSKTSPFYYRIRKESLKYSDISEYTNLGYEQENFEIQNIFDILEESFSELNWFHKSLMEMYLTLGSMKKVSLKTNIPITSISRYIKEAKLQVRTDVNNKIYE